MRRSEIFPSYESLFESRFIAKHIALFQVAEETLSNIQTVVLLGQEEKFFERYRTAMAEPYRYKSSSFNTFSKTHWINVLVNTQYTCMLPVMRARHVGLPENCRDNGLILIFIQEGEEKCPFRWAGDWLHCVYCKSDLFCCVSLWSQAGG